MSRKVTEEENISYLIGLIKFIWNSANILKVNNKQVKLK